MAKLTDQSFYEALVKTKVPFNLITDRKRYDRVRAEGFNPDTKTLRTTKGVVRIPEVRQIVFAGKSAGQFKKSILPLIPEPEKDALSKFVGRRVVLHYLARTETDGVKLEKVSPYFLIVRKDKEFRVVYKLGLFGVAPFNPYPDVGEPESEVRLPDFAGSWRNDWSVLLKMLRRELKKKRYIKVALILRDGREVKGILYYDKMKLFYALRLFSLAPDDTGKRRSIFIYKHAVEDYYLED